MAVQHLRVVGPTAPVLRAPRRMSARSAGVIAALRTRVAHLLCGLRGHARFTHCEPRRVTLRCYYCGHESPGWDVSGRSPVARMADDPKRHVLVVATRTASEAFDAAPCAASREGRNR